MTRADLVEALTVERWGPLPTPAPGPGWRQPPLWVHAPADDLTVARRRHILNEAMDDGRPGWRRTA